MTVSEKEVAVLLDRSRLDPRLMEVMTEFIRDYWWMLDPKILAKSCKRAKDPFVIKVIVACIFDYCEISEMDRKQFADWVQQASAGIKDPNPQLFYLGVFPLFSKSLDREVKESLASFNRHNLFAKDLPFNKGLPGSIKSERNPPANKLHDIDLLKLKLSQNIKSLKRNRGLSNEEIIKLTGINRVFLSNILNNKLEKISADYLASHAANI